MVNRKKKIVKINTCTARKQGLYQWIPVLYWNEFIIMEYRKTSMNIKLSGIHKLFFCEEFYNKKANCAKEGKT